MVTKIGLDLGYANITISDASLEVYREPSVAIIDKNTRRVVSVGRDALKAENANDGMLVRPFKNGLLYSSDLTAEIINNVVAAVSMGVQHISSLKMTYFKGYDDAVTVPKAVEIIQPQRIIITYGTNNTIGYTTEDFIKIYIINVKRK